MRFLFAVTAAFALVGCKATDTDSLTLDPEHTLTFSGTGYDPHDGQKVRATVVDSTDAQLETRDQLVVDGQFDISFPDLPDGDYKLYWFADLSGDDVCEAPPDDHTWSHAFTIAGEDLQYTHPHDTNFDTGACEYIGSN
jgi:hypothetical protein